MILALDLAEDGGNYCFGYFFYMDGLLRYMRMDIHIPRGCDLTRRGDQWEGKFQAPPSSLGSDVERPTSKVRWTRVVDGTDHIWMMCCPNWPPNQLRCWKTTTYSLVS
jgi:hypothetical protein